MVDRHKRLSKAVLDAQTKAKASGSTTPTTFQTTAAEFKSMDLAGTVHVQGKHRMHDVFACDVFGTLGLCM
jgi:hypothetical protein